MKEPEPNEDDYPDEWVQTVKVFNTWMKSGGHPTVGDMLGIEEPHCSGCNNRHEPANCPHKEA